MTEKIHYVYKITNTKPTDSRKYYIGVRSSENPEQDNYWSSSKYLKSAIASIGIENFKKEIMSTWETRELANLEEIKLHREYHVTTNQEFYNRAIASSESFCTIGLTPVVDTTDNTKKSVTLEEFKSNAIYIAQSKGNVSAFDVLDGKTKRVSVEEFNNNSDLVGVNAGNMVVFDTESRCRIQVSVDEYRTNSKYRCLVAGTVPVFNKTTGKIQRISTEEYNNNPELFDHTFKNKVTVRDTTTGKTMNVSKEAYHGNEKYASISSGMVVVRDVISGKTKKVTREEYNSDETLISPCKQMVAAVDINDGTLKYVSMEEYHLSDNLVTAASKKVHIFDFASTLRFTIYGNFRKKCVELGLPSSIFEKSYKTNMPILKHRKYSGWYATVV